MLTVAENISDLITFGGGYTKNAAVSGFRAVRLFRFFRVASQLRSFQVMLKKIMISLTDIANFSILLFLFMFTMTLLGLELYANKVKFDEFGNLDL